MGLSFVCLRACRVRVLGSLRTFFLDTYLVCTTDAHLSEVCLFVCSVSHFFTMYLSRPRPLPLGVVDPFDKVPFEVDLVCKALAVPSLALAVLSTDFKDFWVQALSGYLKVWAL